MLDADTIAAKFLAILSSRTSPGRRENIEQSLRNIFHGHQMGTIFNVDYKDAKDTLSRAADEAWEERMQGRYATGSGLRTPESRVVYDITIMGLHDCISGQKKLPKLIAEEKPSAAFQAEAYAFFDATAPLALIVKDLKAHVVMGRKPNPEAQARRAAMDLKKTIRTCSVCFRPIAVLSNGYIADHGYQLPHQYNKTESCYGGNFRPLEVAPDGLAFMVRELTQKLEGLDSNLNRANSGSLMKLTRRKYSGELLTFTPASPQWQHELEVYRANIASSISAAKRALADYQRRLASWKPTPEGQRYSGGKRRHGNIAKLDAEVRGLLRK